jgi:hypothetical protein
MKTLILSIAIFLSVSSFSQSFDGIPISGDLPTMIAKLKAKGYVYVNTEDGVASLKGKIASIYNVEVLVFTTPKSKKVCKVVAYLDKNINWYSIKAEYEKFVDILTEKYGEPDVHYEFFSSPYEAGDGYEMTALAVEKCTYTTYWLNKNNTSIVVEISKYKQVKLGYENDEIMKIRKSEFASLESNSF